MISKLRILVSLLMIVGVCESMFGPTVAASIARQEESEEAFGPQGSDTRGTADGLATFTAESGMPTGMEVRLVDAGYSDMVLRGRSVSAEYYLRGPGDYRVGLAGNSIQILFSASDVLAAGSLITVVWNGVPIGSQMLDSGAGGPERQQWQISIPGDRINARVNRLQIQGTLRLLNESCVDDAGVGRSVTIYNGTAVRYAYADGERHPTPVVPDLSRYPWPFFDPDAITPSEVVFALPERPSREELDAAAGVSAQLGQFAGTKPLVLGTIQDSGTIPPEVGDANVIYVGKISSLPSLRDSAEVPIRMDADGILTPAGELEQDLDTGVLFELPLPGSPARMLLAITGMTDAAVFKAGQALSMRNTPKLLRGSYALVRMALTRSTTSTGIDEEAVTNLNALGLADAAVGGPGDHSVSFKLDVPGVLQARAAIPLELVLSYSQLLDLDRSSFRVVVNRVPLTSVGFKTLDQTRGTVRVDLPSAAIRPGENAIEVRFTLRVRTLAHVADCGPTPTEQAWAVLHADSSFRPPSSLVPPTDVTLADYPYPFVTRQRLDHTIAVIPAGTAQLGPLLQLLADLGRTAQGEPLTPRIVRASEVRPEELDAHLLLLGTPGENPVLAELAEYLPLRWTQDNRIRYVASDDLRLTIRDDTEIGVLQTIPSPWAESRFILVVSGTTPEMLPLSVRALHQSGLGGNLAVVSPPLSSTTSVSAGGAPADVQVTTYNVKSPRRQERATLGTPFRAFPLVAASAVLLALAIALLLAYQSFVVERRHFP